MLAFCLKTYLFVCVMEYIGEQTPVKKTSTRPQHSPAPPPPFLRWVVTQFHFPYIKISGSVFFGGSDSPTFCSMGLEGNGVMLYLCPFHRIPPNPSAPGKLPAKLPEFIFPENSSALVMQQPKPALGFLQNRRRWRWIGMRLKHVYFFLSFTLLIVWR